MLSWFFVQDIQCYHVTLVDMDDLDGEKVEGKQRQEQNKTTYGDVCLHPTFVLALRNHGRTALYTPVEKDLCGCGPVLLGERDDNRVCQ